MSEYHSVCPSCGSLAHGPMGMLGNRAHYSCRYCGQWWSEQVDTGVQRVAPDAEG